MEEIPQKIQKALADMNWEERLKQARAQREAVLRARAEKGAGAQKSPDRDAPTRSAAATEERRFNAPVAAAETPEELSMNWIDRLNRTRAQREARLQARADQEVGDEERQNEELQSEELQSEELQNEERQNDEPSVIGVVAAEDKTPAEDEAPAAMASIAARSGGIKRAGYIALGCCTGIGLGVGVAIYANQSSTPNATAVAGDTTAVLTAASSNGASQAETASQVAATESTPPLPEGPDVMADLGAEFASPVFDVATELPADPELTANIWPEMAALAVPQVDGAAEVAELVRLDGPQTLQDLSAPPLSFGLQAPQADRANDPMVVADGWLAELPWADGFRNPSRMNPPAVGLTPAPGDVADALTARPEILASLAALPNPAAAETGADISVTAFSLTPPPGVVAAISAPPAPEIGDNPDMSPITMPVRPELMAELTAPTEPSAPSQVLDISIAAFTDTSLPQTISEISALPTLAVPQPGEGLARSPIAQPVRPELLNMDTALSPPAAPATGTGVSLITFADTTTTQSLPSPVALENPNAPEPGLNRRLISVVAPTQPELLTVMAAPPAPIVPELGVSLPIPANRDQTPPIAIATFTPAPELFELRPDLSPTFTPEPPPALSEEDVLRARVLSRLREALSE